MTQVKHVWTEYVSGREVAFIELDNGQQVVIADDLVTLYDNTEDFWIGHYVWASNLNDGSPLEPRGAPYAGVKWTVVGESPYTYNNPVIHHSTAEDPGEANEEFYREFLKGEQGYLANLTGEQLEDLASDVGLHIVATLRGYCST